MPHRPKIKIVVLDGSTKVYYFSFLKFGFHFGMLAKTNINISRKKNQTLDIRTEIIYLSVVRTGPLQMEN